MRLFTCEFSRMSEQLIQPGTEFVRIGEPNLIEHNVSDLFDNYVIDLLEEEFEPSEDVIVLAGHFKRAAVLMAAAQQVCPGEPIRVTHYNNKLGEFVYEWLTPQDNEEAYDVDEVIDEDSNE